MMFIGIQICLNIQKSIDATYIKILKKKNLMIISINVKYHLTRHTPINNKRKNYQQTRNRGKCLTLLKDIDEKLTANILILKECPFFP